MGCISEAVPSLTSPGDVFRGRISTSYSEESYVWRHDFALIFV